MLDILIKSFDELNTKELYELLRLRSEVFVLEQNCVYQDLDNKDQYAMHILGFKKNVLVAYTRIFKGGDYFEQSSIGRVIVDKEYRMFGYGYDIVQASIKAIKNHYKTKSIKISAQKYLINFYNRLGFKEKGEEYLEDGIPHVAMYRD